MIKKTDKNYRSPVVHKEQLKLLHVVHEELVEAVGQEVAGALVRSCQTTEKDERQKWKETVERGKRATSMSTVERGFKAVSRKKQVFRAIIHAARVRKTKPR